MRQIGIRERVRRHRVVVGVRVSHDSDLLTVGGARAAFDSPEPYFERMVHGVRIDHCGKMVCDAAEPHPGYLATWVREQVVNEFAAANVRVRAEKKLIDIATSFANMPLTIPEFVQGLVAGPVVTARLVPAPTGPAIAKRGPMEGVESVDRRTIANAGDAVSNVCMQSSGHKFSGPQG